MTSTFIDVNGRKVKMADPAVSTPSTGAALGFKGDECDNLLALSSFKKALSHAKARDHALLLAGSSLGILSANRRPCFIWEREIEEANIPIFKRFPDKPVPFAKR